MYLNCLSRTLQNHSEIVLETKTNKGIRFHFPEKWPNELFIKFDTIEIMKNIFTITVESKNR